MTIGAHLAECKNPRIIERYLDQGQRLIVGATRVNISPEDTEAYRRGRYEHHRPCIALTKGGRDAPCLPSEVTNSVLMTIKRAGMEHELQDLFLRALRHNDKVDARKTRWGAIKQLARSFWPARWNRS